VASKYLSAASTQRETRRNSADDCRRLPSKQRNRTPHTIETVLRTNGRGFSNPNPNREFLRLRNLLRSRKFSWCDGQRRSGQRRTNVEPHKTRVREWADWLKTVRSHARYVLRFAGKNILLASNAVLTSSVTMSASSNSGVTRSLRSWSYCRGGFLVSHCLSRAH